MSETNAFEELIVMRSKGGDGTIYRQRPLVRCKDCRYYTEPDSHGDRCGKIHWSRGDDWFCADGKQKDN